jgi:uncharacterized membrane protein
MSNEELYTKYQSLFSEPLEAESPVSQSVEVLQPKKMVGHITEEEFDKMFEDILKK